MLYQLNGLLKIIIMSKLKITITINSVPLKENKLRRVEASRWKIEPEEDQNGFKKVFELETFKGIFKDS